MTGWWVSRARTRSIIFLEELSVRDITAILSGHNDISSIENGQALRPLLIRHSEILQFAYVDGKASMVEELYALRQKEVLSTADYIVRVSQTSVTN